MAHKNLRVIANLLNFQALGKAFFKRYTYFVIDFRGLADRWVG